MLMRNGMVVTRDRKLGSGKEGSVYLAYVKDTDGESFVAANKEVVSAPTRPNYELEMLSLFAESNARVGVPHLIASQTWARTDLGKMQHNFVIPCYPETLADFLDNVAPGVAGTLAILQKLVEVGEALEFLKSVRVVHNDIKVENVCIDMAHKAVLIDFGLSRRIPVLNRSVVVDGILGTPWFCPIEKLRSRSRIGFESDVFAFGMFIYECFLGTPAIKDCCTIPQLQECRLNNECVDWGNFEEVRIVSLVNRMSAMLPQKRPPIGIVVDTLRSIMKECAAKTPLLTPEP